MSQEVDWLNKYIVVSLYIVVDCVITVSWHKGKNKQKQIKKIRTVTMLLGLYYCVPN